MAARPGQPWRALTAALTIPILALTFVVLWLAQSAPASPAVQPVDPCAVVTPGPPPPPNDKPPVAVLTAPAKAQVGQAVLFDGSTSHSPTATVASWCWTFGDGSHAFGAKVSHTYTKSGTDSVALTVTDGFGLTGRAFSTITVMPAITVRLVLKESAHHAANRLRSGERVRLYGSVTQGRRSPTRSSRGSRSIRAIRRRSR